MAFQVEEISGRVNSLFKKHSELAEQGKEWHVTPGGVSRDACFPEEALPDTINGVWDSYKLRTRSLTAITPPSQNSVICYKKPKIHGEVM